jgi:hypothetical protein
LTEPAIETCGEVAKIAGVSTGTLYKVKKIVERATQDVKQRMQSSELSIDAAYKRVWNGDSRRAGTPANRMTQVRTRMRLAELKAALEAFRAVVRKGGGALTSDQREAFLTEVASFLSEMQTMWLQINYPYSRRTYEQVKRNIARLRQEEDYGR